MDLVEELFLARSRRHVATGPRHFRDHHRPALGHFGKRETQIVEPGDVLVSRIGKVATRHLTRAFQQVADQRRAGDLVPGVETPPEFVGKGCNKKRGIRGSPGDHDIGAKFQRMPNFFCADVSIRRNKSVSKRRNRLVVR